MLRGYVRYGLLLHLLVLCSICSTSQMIIPWGYALNLSFGRGTTDPGPPLPKGYSSLSYTTSLCPDPGYYTVESKFNCPNFDSYKFDAGHYYFHGVRQP